MHTYAQNEKIRGIQFASDTQKKTAMFYSTRNNMNKFACALHLFDSGLVLDGNSAC